MTAPKTMNKTLRLIPAEKLKLRASIPNEENYLQAATYLKILEEDAITITTEQIARIIYEKGDMVIPWEKHSFEKELSLSQAAAVMRLLEGE